MDVPLVTFKGNSGAHGGGNCPADVCSEQPPPYHNEDYDVHAVLSRTTSHLEQHEILTSSGIRHRVYVQPSKSKLALLTYHDIGTNHISFLGFFNHPEMRVIAKHFAVYHICAPGHHENASNELFDDPSTDQFLLVDSKEDHNFGSMSHLKSDEDHHSPHADKGVSYPTLDQLAQMLTSVLVHFGIEYFIGFGMGAGSNVLARYALNHPDNVLGLFLLNPNATTHPYYQRLRCRWWDLPYLQQGHLTDNLFEQLDAHWFGFGLAENEDVARFYHQLARSLNPVNMAGYIQAYMERTPLNLVRSLGPAMPGETPSGTHEPTVIKTDVCLVTGSRAVDLSRTMAEMNGQMDPKCTQFIAIPDTTGMVMEENPDKLAMDFLHFLRSIGLLINLTPEKLRHEATALQLLQSPYACDPLNVPSTPARLDVANEA